MPAPQASPLLAGERSLRPHLWQLASTAGIVVAGVVGYAVTPLTGDRSWLGAVLALGAIGVIAPLTVRRVRAVVTSDQPVLEAIQAVVLLLTVLVFGFAGLFVALDQHGDQFVGLDTKLDAVYFTVTTLSTVGYGDVHAVGQAGRLAVTLQIVFNLTFLAVAVRVLVGAAQRRLAERLDTGDPLPVITRPDPDDRA
ncbi:MAG TPA: potassium channel family protein [Acidimicrobiales bacterium]|nr:potassium channel family protein [Acidimicrobiales bacterium]